jgi:hypothetical protein
VDEALYFVGVERELDAELQDRKIDRYAETLGGYSI